MNDYNDKFKETLVPWIGRTAKMMWIHLKNKLNEAGLDLTPKQLITLKHLVLDDGKEQKYLANITGRDKTSLTRLITTMEKKGLVTRRTSESDKRVNLLFITDKGRAVFTEALPVIESAITDVQSGIEQQELEAAIETIEKVHNNVKELIS